MPLFYVIPFKFKKDRSKARAVEIQWSDALLYGTLGLIALAMFFALIVVPVMMLINQSLPGIQIQPPSF